jgi:hypothetical protein
VSVGSIQAWHKTVCILRDKFSKLTSKVWMSFVNDSPGIQAIIYKVGQCEIYSCSLDDHVALFCVYLCIGGFLLQKIYFSTFILFKKQNN